MATLSSIQIPPPSDWHEFEEIALTSLKIKWQSPNLTHNGRQGQAQAGVDIYGADELGRHVGVQCKKFADITKATITDEIAKAESFTPKLTAFFVATTAPSDANIQKEVRRISEERVKTGKFPVGIFFWDDLVQELVKNQQEFVKHYPQIHLRGLPSGARMLCLLDIAYYGLNIQNYIELIFGEFGLMAGEDPYQIQRILMIVSACGTTTFDNTAAKRLADACDNLTQFSLTPTKPDGWNPGNILATTIETYVSKAEYGLSGQELAAFTIGKILGRWHTSNDEELPASTEKRILDIVEILKPDEELKQQIVDAIEQHRKFEVAKSSRAANTAHRLYQIFRRIISHMDMVS